MNRPLGIVAAIYQNIDIIESYGARINCSALRRSRFIRMDYELMLQQHIEQGTDVTVGCLEISPSESRAFGIVHGSAVTLPVSQGCSVSRVALQRSLLFSGVGEDIPQPTINGLNA